MPDLADVITRLATLDRLEQRIKTEREELVIAKRVLERLAQPKPTAARIINLLDSAGAGEEEPSRQRDLYIAVLRDSITPWLTANEVQAEASRRKGAEIPMSSVSPGLTALKNDGVIVRDGLKVALADRVVNTNRAPNA